MGESFFQQLDNLFGLDRGVNGEPSVTTTVALDEVTNTFESLKATWHDVTIVVDPRRTSDLS